MENNILNKQIFFGQYYMQDVFRQLDESEQSSILFPNTGYLNGWLELKPLSSITDEDAIKVAEYSYTHLNETYADWAKKMIISGQLIHSQYVTDYLRSKGYALPWIGLSVEHQIEYGWIKLL